MRTTKTKEKIKNIFLNLILICGILGIICSVVFFISVKIQNPDLTDTRLTFMYWKEIVATFVLFIAAFVSAKFRFNI